MAMKNVNGLNGIRKLEAERQVPVYSVNGAVIETVKLPSVFYTPFRPDIIKRAFLSDVSKSRQPYGSDLLAGKRSSAHYHGKREYRFSMMNKEMSRLPRIHGKGAGYYAFRARIAPQAVKGRRAHPPKSEKIWEEKINKKELLLAIKSALAASSHPDIVTVRGHKIKKDLPIIIEDVFEKKAKTKDVKLILEKVGLSEELQRCSKKKVRAGRGKMRGRKYKKKVGPIIVVSKECELLKSAKNIPGVDVVTLKNLKPSLLAPGAHPGRLLVITKSALKEVEDLDKLLASDAKHH